MRKEKAPIHGINCLADHFKYYSDSTNQFLNFSHITLYQTSDSLSILNDFPELLSNFSDSLHTMNGMNDTISTQKLQKIIYNGKMDTTFLFTPSFPKVPDFKAKAKKKARREIISQLEKNKIDIPQLKEVKQVKKDLDSGNWEKLDSKAEDVLANQFEALGELQSLEGKSSLDELTSIQEISWDESKVAASQEVVQMLAKHSEKIQTALKEMEDFKKQYSKVNLMNPNGPVLQEMDKTPVDRWRFGLVDIPVILTPVPGILTPL